MGKAILAHLDADEVQALLGAGGSLPEFADIRADLGAVNARGYATDTGESQPHLFCVGAPIFDRRGQPRYAISASGPGSRMTAEVQATIGVALREATAEISIALGQLPTARAESEKHRELLEAR